ncbi:MAG: hypothetical protein Kow0056_09390 [Coriobacteriia bacterium]
MIFGLGVTAQMLVPGGFFLLALLVFQLLVGKRIIRFAGRTHMRVHRWGAYLLGVVAVGHALLALTYIYHWRIP